MKKSELRQIIKEEIQKLTEVEVDTSQYQFTHGRKPKSDGGWMFKIGKEEWAAPGRLMYGQAVKAAKAYAKKKGVTKIEVMP